MAASPTHRPRYRWKASQQTLRIGSRAPLTGYRTPIKGSRPVSNKTSHSPEHIMEHSPAFTGPLLVTPCSSRHEPAPSRKARLSNFATRRRIDVVQENRADRPASAQAWESNSSIREWILDASRAPCRASKDLLMAVEDIELVAARIICASTPSNESIVACNTHTQWGGVLQQACAGASNKPRSYCSR